MANDSYVQVAVDGVGKKVSMDQQVDAAGNQVYVQKALLVGDPADMLAQIFDTDRQILAVLRALLRATTDTSNSRITEEDFSSTPGENYDG